MPRVTTHLFTDEQVTFAPLLDPMGVLTDLLQAYAEGLTQPLPLYPKSSLEYVEKPAGDAAHKKFYGSEYSTSTAEGDYPSVKLAMRGVADPLGDRFKSVSQQLLAPMLASLTRSTP
jgi:exodeoxyribonuclease V gamma subunit